VATISPLGVARRQTLKPPGVWRVVPLLAGLAELGFWAVHGHPASIPGQVQAFFSSFLLRSARDGSRLRPLPGRGDGGRVPDEWARRQRPPVRLEQRQRDHLAAREHPGRAP
jgi:hypothetical protein